MNKKCKVVMLATEKKAVNGQLCINDSYLPGLFPPVCRGYDSSHLTPQHLYILSNDEIKNEDYAYCWVDKVVGKVIKVGPIDHGVREIIIRTNNVDIRTSENNFSKVIATTDSSLKLPCKYARDKKWFDGLPSIPQSFIEQYISEYNKGNKIEEVMVEYHLTTDKRECLKVSPKDNTINIKSIKDSWTREEVIALLNTLEGDIKGQLFFSIKLPDNYLDNWIKNNL